MYQETQTELSCILSTEICEFGVVLLVYIGIVEFSVLVVDKKEGKNYVY